MAENHKAIALGPRLRKCRSVLTLGVHANFSDYNKDETRLILGAEKIYFPSTLYAELFDTLGKKTFPSYHTYKCVQDKIKQTALFKMLGLPHPRTMVFYGKTRQDKITDFFSFPFVAKIPRGSAMGRGVFLIKNHQDLSEYRKRSRVAYIQEYIENDRDIRVVVIGKKIVHAYWRIADRGEFRSNVALGGRISLSPVPDKALELALNTARACKWDDVGIDIMEKNGKYFIIEANMKYGREGFRAANIDYIELMESLIENGEI